MTYQPRSYADIAAARKERIRAGELLTAKLRCFMCDYAVGKGVLFCSGSCASDYHAERAELAPLAA